MGGCLTGGLADWRPTDFSSQRGCELAAAAREDNTAGMLDRAQVIKIHLFTGICPEFGLGSIYSEGLVLFSDKYTVLA